MTAGTLGAVALVATLVAASSSEAQETPSDTAAPSSTSSAERSGAAAPDVALVSTPDARRAAAQEQAADRRAAAEAAKAAEEAEAAARAEAKAAAKAAAKAKAEAERQARLAEITPGEQGEHVARMQERLRQLGYQVTSADGVYGAETWQAVVAFQKVAGLGRDAVVGPATQKALDDGVVPVSRYGGTGIEVDLGRQVLLVVENGKVIRTFNAASGNGESYEALGAQYVAHTPSGSFAVYRQVDGIRESSLDLGSMYRPKYFTGAIAVHGSPSIPAYPASHGCIRVSNTAMDWIWSWGASVGTPVHVY
ncbi:murein L,D-transpeptidase [Myceligenerans sp. I2]|uniref:Murein L,D-transpeptidase n=2 Tax=Myceligenerans indicum TaxID=2593663 RepID=A0ABS1LG97_9MICO|nr:murein L,D-transpeptidase [Myceligenerans indicum]